MTQNKRAILVVLDSVGVGHGRDADKFFNDDTPDTGADTFGHIAAFCEAGKADGRTYNFGGRQLGVSNSGPLNLPNLRRHGYFAAADIAAGREIEVTPEALVTSLHEVSPGKDTTSGHMEICGLPVEKDWGYFPREIPCFPEGFMCNWIAENGLKGVLGERHASGTEIMQSLGVEHMETGKPIVYTSADSVFQVVAHEETFGLERLYAICASARKMLDPLNIGRVIARPFIGTSPKNFERTANRKDFAMPPPGDTLLDVCVSSNLSVHAIGKISDIFNGQGVSKSTKANGLPNLFEATIRALKQDTQSGLIFVNFVDFDTEFGHRRDPAGYAAALEYFDSRLPEILEHLGDGDLLAITADHGNDPTWVGTDHTREQIPLLLIGKGIEPGVMKPRQTFADIGQTLATHLKIPALKHGTSIL